MVTLPHAESRKLGKDKQNKEAADSELRLVEFERDGRDRLQGIKQSDRLCHAHGTNNEANNSQTMHLKCVGGVDCNTILIARAVTCHEPARAEVQCC